MGLQAVFYNEAVKQMRRNGVDRQSIYPTYTLWMKTILEALPTPPILPLHLVAMLSHINSLQAPPPALE